MIPVIDLFAGPGGLNEGFSSLVDVNGNYIFKTLMSVEKEETAHKTLRLRAFYRAMVRTARKVPEAYFSYLDSPTQEKLDALIKAYPKEWAEAESEAVCAELKEGDSSLINDARNRLKIAGVNEGDDWVLIGGPPCQAYSLVGRSRRAHDETLQSDVKQTLYKCYLAFITELKPTVFVMENVKGMLSAEHDGEGIFGRIKQDMQDAGYAVHSLVNADPRKPADYVVEAENYGIPQARHRVILLGVRDGIEADVSILEQQEHPVTLAQALEGIPCIRSGFSKRNHGWKEMNWREYVRAAISKMKRTSEGIELAEQLNIVLRSRPPKLMSKNRIDPANNIYHVWYRGLMGKHKVLPNHEARCHLASDIDRYLFCAAYAKEFGEPARLYDFPDYLIPNHQNAKDAKELRRKGEEIKFNDRFRVQLADRPSTTITSHISKDGHYYIHPDPNQARSLTVREAARLQTFPDDYYFEGNRTAQYQQVGNAVPPLLAQQIAKVVAGCLGIQGKSFFDFRKDKKKEH